MGDRIFTLLRVAKLGEGQAVRAEFEICVKGLEVAVHITKLQWTKGTDPQAAQAAGEVLRHALVDELKQLEGVHDPKIRD